MIDFLFKKNRSFIQLGDRSYIFRDRSYTYKKLILTLSKTDHLPIQKCYLDSISYLEKNCFLKHISI